MRILGVTFTLGVSLEVWVNLGLFDREKKIYEEHLKQGHFDKVIWFTYGIGDNKVRDELVQAGRLDKRVQVVPMPRFFITNYMAYVYSYLLPFIQKRYCKNISIIKTNQMDGAWTAEIIHKKYRVPFLLRTGYTRSSFLALKLKEESNILKRIKLSYKYKRYRKIESFLYRCCTWAIVSSEHDKKYVCKQYVIPETKLDILTNYIDCDLFKKRESVKRENDRFIFVGRLSEQKNLFHIIQALGELQIGLDIYGKGELQKALVEFVKMKQYDVCFKGTVNNSELPQIYNMYRYYILASTYEGMPKTLLEAMACGCICFGTNVDGISEVIKDRENGYLIRGISVESIKKAVINGIQQVANDRISENAIQYINKQHSLENIVAKEWKILKYIGGLVANESIEKNNLPK